jgi:hypothetical protein
MWGGLVLPRNGIGICYLGRCNGATIQGVLVEGCMERDYGDLM